MPKRSNPAFPDLFPRGVPVVIGNSSLIGTYQGNAGKRWGGSGIGLYAQMDVLGAFMRGNWSGLDAGHMWAACSISGAIQKLWKSYALK